MFDPLNQIVGGRRIAFKRGLHSGRTVTVKPKLAKPTYGKQHHSRSLQWLECVAASLLFVYFIRGTMLPRRLPVPSLFWIGLNVLALLVGSVIAVTRRGRWNWLWILTFVSFAPGILLAEQKTASAFRWVGLVLLTVTAGPIIFNPVTVALRAALWRQLIKGITMLTAIFALWHAFHIPSIGGRGEYFNAFMNQSMLLGPLAGLGVVIALARAINTQSWQWGLFAIIGLAPVLASGSRLAAIATIATGCFLITRHKPAIGMFCGILCALAIYGFATHMENLRENDSSISVLANKGLGNSRAGRWEDRLNDYQQSPWFGVGIGMGTDSRRSDSADADISGVEPGSSYLGILAMTGAVGSLTFLIAMGVLVYRFVLSSWSGGTEKDILWVVGVYLAIHGLAEGWILGFGSPLCFIFWLCVGRASDCFDFPSLAGAGSFMRARPRARREMPAFCAS